MKTISRRVNRVVRVLLILLLTLYASVGCFRTAKYEAGNTVAPITGPGTDTRLMMQTDKDTFSTDDITVDLSYGWYDIEETKERYNGNYKWILEEKGLKNIEYGIYARPEKYHRSDRFSGVVFEDKSIDHYYLVKELSGELFTEEYGYTVGFLNFISYNHKEQITIPKEAFEEKERVPRIHLVIIGWAEDDSGAGYRIKDMAYLSIRYKYIDDNTIQFVNPS